MKAIFEGLGFLGLMVEAVTLYTFVACCVNNTPFPVWFRPAMWSILAIYVAGLVVGLTMLFRRKKHGQRLGMVQMDEHGEFYIKK